MPEKIPLPREVMGDSFHVRDAAQRGLMRGRAAGKDLQRSFHGIRSAGLDLDDVRGRCHAFQAVLRENECFSHTTAAMVMRLPLPPRLDHARPIHVTTVNGSTRRGRGVIGHHSHEAVPTQMWDGIRITTPVRTWIDLAALIDTTDLVVVGDALVAGEHPLCTVEDLARELREADGRRGITSGRCAVEMIRVGVDSPMETRLRLVLVDGGLPEPLVNMRYYDAYGSYLGKADLSYPQWRIVIEYEGDGHRSDPDQFNEDIRRRERFESAGWSVVRVAKAGVFDHPDETIRVVRDRIALQLRRRAAETSDR